MQIPHFEVLGLTLSSWHPATLNVSISPYLYEPLSPRYTFESIKWHPDEPAETFSFFDCEIEKTEALIYYPHPEHEQPEDVLEIWASRNLPFVNYGTLLRLLIDPSQMKLSL